MDRDNSLEIDESNPDIYVCPKCQTKADKESVVKVAVNGNFREKFSYLEGEYCVGCWIEFSFKDVPKLNAL